jgi:hypothetical protein
MCISFWKALKSAVRARDSFWFFRNFECGEAGTEK